MTALIGPMRYQVFVLLGERWVSVQGNLTRDEAEEQAAQWVSLTRIETMY